jgi:hypothetical protein
VRLSNPAQARVPVILPLPKKESRAEGTFAI